MVPSGTLAQGKGVGVLIQTAFQYEFHQNNNGAAAPGGVLILMIFELETLGNHVVASNVVISGASLKPILAAKLEMSPL